LFSQSAVGSIDFAIGYRWRPRSSNLIVATRTDAATLDAAAGMNPGSISGAAHSNHEVMSDKKTAEAVADTDKDKTAKGRKSHHSSKYVTRKRPGARTRRLLAHRTAPQPFWFADW
jgi:hypothetical protein